MADARSGTVFTGEDFDPRQRQPQGVAGSSPAGGASLATYEPGQVVR